MKHQWNIAIAGATGIVGQELLKVLEKRNFPCRSLKCFASYKSEGKRVCFKGNHLTITKPDFREVDLAFLCAGATFSKQWKNILEKCKVVDLSSAFREESQIPLIIPEINGSSISRKDQYICSPNCIATLMLMAIYPLHQALQIKKIIGSTYQSASGGGQKMIERLLNQNSNSEACPYVYNVFSHDSALEEDGFNSEEKKIATEAKKILREPTLSISMTCIRVPVLRAHCISLHITFEKPFVLNEIYELLSKAPGIKIFEDKVNNRFATPYDATEKDSVFVSRIRKDPDSDRSLFLWVVGDQLLKGAALNAVQIAETIKEIYGLYTTNRS